MRIDTRYGYIDAVCGREYVEYIENLYGDKVDLDKLHQEVLDTLDREIGIFYELSYGKVDISISIILNENFILGVDSNLEIILFAIYFGQYGISSVNSYEDYDISHEDFHKHQESFMRNVDQVKRDIDSFKKSLEEKKNTPTTYGLAVCASFKTFPDMTNRLASAIETYVRTYFKESGIFNLLSFGLNITDMGNQDYEVYVNTVFEAKEDNSLHNTGDLAASAIKDLFFALSSETPTVTSNIIKL